MRRVILCLPVCMIGVPLLSFLILAQTRSGADTGKDAPAPPPAPAVEVKKGALPDNATMAKLASGDPVAFLENCLAKYQREVKTGYALTLAKRETLAGTDYPQEMIEVTFRTQPYSVFFQWSEGARKAERVLYVEGANKDKKGKSALLIRPSGPFIRRLVGDVVARDVDGAEAKLSGHYTLDDFGFKNSEERTLRAWKAGLKAGTLRVDYLGIEKIKELNDRPAFVLRGTDNAPGADGVSVLNTYFDTETWLQTGSILKDKTGKVIGEYYFRNVRLNPEFKKGQFERSALQ